MSDHDETTTTAEAAAVLREILEAVDRGDLEADTPQGKRLLRRLEGAVAALEADQGDDG